MAKLETLILSLLLVGAINAISLPSLNFFGSEKDQSGDDFRSEHHEEHKHEEHHDSDKHDEYEHDEHQEHPFSTLNLPGLPAIPLPPMPPMPAFLQRPVIKATKTIYVEVTHFEKSHPVCWTEDSHKPPCDSYDHHIKPSSTVHSVVKPTRFIKNPFAALQEKFKPKPHKPSEDYKPVDEHEEEYEHEPEHGNELEASASEPEVEHEAPKGTRDAKYIQFGTPVVPSKEEVHINEAPEESDKDSRIIQRFMGRPVTHYETKTIYTTKTKKYNDYVTATLVVDNCVPVDLAIPKCKKVKEPLIDTYGQDYEHHFDETPEDHQHENGGLNLLQQIIAQQSAFAEGGAHYAAQVAAQHAAYHAALAHKFHSAAAQFAQNNANNALAAEHAALETAHHHQIAEQAAHENVAHILGKKPHSKYTTEKTHEEEHTTKEEHKEPVKPNEPAEPNDSQDHWRIVSDQDE